MFASKKGQIVRDSGQNIREIITIYSRSRKYFEVYGSVITR